MSLWDSFTMLLWLFNKVLGWDVSMCLLWNCNNIFQIIGSIVLPLACSSIKQYHLDNQSIQLVWVTDDISLHKCLWNFLKCCLITQIRPNLLKRESQPLISIVSIDHIFDTHQLHPLIIIVTLFGTLTSCHPCNKGFSLTLVRKQVCW